MIPIESIGLTLSPGVSGSDECLTVEAAQRALRLLFASPASPPLTAVRISDPPELVLASLLLKIKGPAI